MTPSERDAARRAAYDRKIARAGASWTGSTHTATIFNDGLIRLDGEWSIVTLSALLQSYLEGDE